MDKTDLYITKKRKKWKFAHFDEWPNCFNESEVDKLTWRYPLIVEFGAGAANLSLELARQNPDKNYVAVDVKSDRLYAGAKKSLSQKIENISFLRAHLANCEYLFAPKSLDEIWITFPDPFPRKRQAKHRLTNKVFLSKYRNLLKKDGIIRFKTDNRALFLWSLEQIIEDGWRIKELSFDLHESGLSNDYKIQTTFEKRFISEGIPINYVSFC